MFFLRCQVGQFPLQASVFFVFLCLTACSSSTQYPVTTKFSGHTMTIDYSIIIGQPLNASQQNQILAIIESTFNEINTIYNKWNPDSELSRLNRLKAMEIATLSPQLEHFFWLADRLVRACKGKFDPTIEPVQQLWKEHLSQGKEPSSSDIEALAPAIGWHHLHILQGVFYKDHDQTKIDFGGIVKGYCVDLLVERLNAAGYPDVFVEWGGEIRASGQHPQKRLWSVFISRLDDIDPTHAIALVPLDNQAIATSGDYLQNWKIRHPSTGEEVVYFHIIDPGTLRPLTAKSDSIASASVLSSNCMEADVLATNLMLFPTIEEAEVWIHDLQREIPGSRYWLHSRLLNGVERL